MIRLDRITKHVPDLFAANDPPGYGGPLLIKGATVAAMSDTADDLEHGDILVRDGRIAGVAPSIGAHDAFVIDAAGMIAIPGFHDTHRHSWEGQLRRIMPSGDIDDYTCTTHKGFAEHYAPEDVCSLPLTSIG